MSYTAPFNVMEFTNPKDYRQHELKVAPQVRLHTTFRLQMTMDEKVRDFARRNKTDISVVVRHALHEYLEKREIDAYQPLCMN